MRRRLVVLALVLDTLAGAAVALGMPLPTYEAEDDRYAVVAGTCVEVLDTKADLLAGRPVASELCAGA